MLKKLNLSKAKAIYGLGIVLTIAVMSIVSCTKENELSNPTDQANPVNNSSSNGNDRPLSFIIKNGTANQTFSISCTCEAPFTLTSNPSALYYGTSTSTSISFSNVNYATTLQKNQYYYVIPAGGTFGSNTKCLKVNFITGNTKPKFSYNASTNTWTGLKVNADINATQVAKSTVPACTTC